MGQFVLLGEAIVRGMNYLTIPARSSDTLTQLEHSMPLWVWGWTFIVCGVLGLVGEALLSGTTTDGDYNPRAWPSFLAHGALMCLFIAISLGTLAAVVQRVPLYGFIAPCDLMAFAVGHWIFARRRKHVR